MIRPERCRFMIASAARVQRNGARRLVASTRSQAAESFQRAGKDLLDDVLLSGVASQHFDGGASAPQLCRDTLQSVGVTAVEQKRRLFPGERNGDPAANPPTGAGNDCALAGQFGHK